MYIEDSMYSKEIDIISCTLSHAAEVSEEILTQDSFELQQKKDNTEVTIADLINQIIINKALIDHYPDEDMIGEESDIRNYSDELLEQVSVFLKEHESIQMSISEIKDILCCKEEGTSNYFWTADPIDGTKGFAQHKQFAEMLAHLNQDGLLQSAGIVFHDTKLFPEKGYELFVAKRGEGAFVGKEQTQLHVESNESQLSIITRSKFEDPEFLEAVKEQFDVKCIESIKATSQIALIALNKLDVFMQQADEKEPLMLWDLAAPILIAQEAGAIITDLEGNTYHLSKEKVQTESPSGILITNNPQIHQRMLELWAQINKSS